MVIFGVSKINWIMINNDYINGRGSYRKLADKYGISATSIGKRARLEGWAEQREKQLHKSYTKVAQKTADRIAEREADRVARLLGTTDKLQDALERAADELDRQMVKSRTRTRETVYGGAQAPESGKPVKETVREEEQIEIAEGLIDRLGLQQLKNETVEYKGEQIPRYVAQQRMREMERSVRKYRREAAVASDERAVSLLEKEREARARYVDFCKETGLKEQPERFRTANIGGGLTGDLKDGNINYNSLPKTLRLPDETLKQTVNVDLPLIHGVVPAGAKLTSVTVIAGNGTSTRIRDIKRLCDTYPEGGDREGWQKKAGKVIADNFIYEIHWYENSGFVFPNEIKLKGARKT